MLRWYRHFVFQSSARRFIGGRRPPDRNATEAARNFTKEKKILAVEKKTNSKTRHSFPLCQSQSMKFRSLSIKLSDQQQQQQKNRKKQSLFSFCCCCCCCNSIDRTGNRRSDPAARFFFPFSVGSVGNYPDKETYVTIERTFD